MRLMVLVALTLLHAASDARALEPEKVRFPSYASDQAKIDAYLLRPKGDGPFPAVIALHGCGGLWKRNQTDFSARHADWAERLKDAGYVVLFPDSFKPRGHASLCRSEDRPVKHSHRVADLRAAADWLAGQSFVDAKRIAVLGWSYGGGVTLRALAPGRKPDKVEFVAAIAFYPGCKWLLEKTTWLPRLKPLILIGKEDDWTPPAPCGPLSQRWGARLVLYEGAYHGFDAPGSKPRPLKGIPRSSRGDGIVHVGTNTEARAAAIAEVTAHLKAAFEKAREPVSR